MKVRAEDIEPGDIIVTTHGDKYECNSFWMEDFTVTIFGTDGSETDYDYDEDVEVIRD